MCAMPPNSRFNTDPQQVALRLLAAGQLSGALGRMYTLALLTLQEFWDKANG
jgi:hypothetical protein